MKEHHYIDSAELTLKIADVFQVLSNFHINHKEKGPNIDSETMFSFLLKNSLKVQKTEIKEKKIKKELSFHNFQNIEISQIQNLFNQEKSHELEFSVFSDLLSKKFKKFQLNDKNHMLHDPSQKNNTSKKVCGKIPRSLSMHTNQMIKNNDLNNILECNFKNKRLISGQNDPLESKKLPTLNNLKEIKSTTSPSKIYQKILVSKNLQNLIKPKPNIQLFNVIKRNIAEEIKQLNV